MDILKLIEQMTLEEKLAQMTQIPPQFFLELSKTQVFGERRNIRFSKQSIMSVGSILGVYDADEMIQIQTMILEESRLKIPSLFMADIIHGYQTIFPIPLALASSFNEEMMEDVSHIAGIEASTSGIHITFAPMVDLARDARWGRVMEGFGEDPYLASKMAVASVKGFQKGDPRSDTYIGACFKHFAGYGASEAGRDYNTVDMSYERFYNLYAKPYEAAIKAGSDMTMLAFNTWSGIPSTIHKKLIREILIKEMGFEGVIISDYDALSQTIAHGASRDALHACEQGLNAGLMIEMGTNQFINYGQESVEKNLVDIETINEAVYKILKLKDKLGLFENPFKGADKEKASKLVRHPDHLKMALKAAEQSMVLLKNNGVLPLSNIKVIGLSGPFADSQRMLGSWHWQGRYELNQTYSEVFRDLGYQIHIIDQDHLKDLEKVDVVVHMTGEPDYDTGESRSKVNIHLTEKEEAWIQTVQRHQKKIISVVHSGRPLVITPLLKSDAIVYAWYGGSMHTRAVANLFLGSTAFSAKLPMSLPRHVGQYPMSYHDFTTGRPYDKNHPEYTTKYIDIDLTPAFMFGYGLTYDSLTFNAFIPSKIDILQEPLELTISINNSNNRPVEDVFQLYYQLRPSQPVMGEKHLIRFQHLSLNPHETKKITFVISPKELMHYDENKQQHPDDGILTLFGGFSSHKLTSFTIDWRHK